MGYESSLKPNKFELDFLTKNTVLVNLFIVQINKMMKPLQQTSQFLQYGG